MQTPNEPCDPCEELNSFLYAYVDGELEDSIVERLARHLATCEHCSDRVDAERHVRELMRRCYAEHAPGDLKARVLTRIRMTHVEAHWE